MRDSLQHDVRFLVHLLREGYDRKAWHGPNLKGALRGLTVEQASWRPAPGRHNIWEIAVHAAYWKYAVRRRITGEKRGSFPIKGSNWFKRPMVITRESWREDLALLDSTHRSLLDVVSRIHPAVLDRRPRNSTVTTRMIIAGIAAHDIYHAGQIQLLKRLMEQ